MEVFLLFVLYSFFGCVLENAYHFILYREYISKRTLINLPLCPVYGIAALVLWVVNGETQSMAVLFANGFFAVSAVELCAYLVSVRAYNIKLWDYSEMKLNFMGGISLFYSVLWGMLNIVFAKVVHPASSDWIFSLPRETKLLAGLFLAVFITADFKETHRQLVRRKKGENNVIDEKFLYLEHDN